MDGVKANPINFSQLSTGASFVLAKNTSMPFADVNISISAVKHWNLPGYAPLFDYDVTMDSTFLVESTIDQNCSIAFAYPENWRTYVMYNGSLAVTYPEFEILFDTIPISYVEIDRADFDRETLPTNVKENFEFITQVHFAIINVTFVANTTHTLDVHCRMEFSSSTEFLRFSYCFGSARTWDGYTIEKIRIEVLNDELFDYVSFQPDSIVEIQNDDHSITGSWSLNISGSTPDFIDYATCYLDQSHYPYDAPDEVYALIIFIPPSTILVIVFTFLYIRRRKRTL